MTTNTSYNSADHNNVEEVFTEVDLLSTSEFNDMSDMDFEVLLPAGQYVIRFSRMQAVPMAHEGVPKQAGFRADHCQVVYDIKNGKDVFHSCGGYEWLRSAKTGKVNPESAKVRVDVISALALAYAWSGEGTESPTPVAPSAAKAMRAEMYAMIKQGVEGYTPAEILRSARDFYCIAQVRVKPAYGEYSESNEIALRSLLPITSLLLSIVTK